ncbi:hypothetical protein QBC40DRAFT_250424 [Triangularia verruculosa]|uniref:Uncharacterized protein n=1 Tax=Triangularia verruculosa TaxID=2587418 RepID=A0AAN7AWQ5_9PEZI|nr:hypothetical protein QBC40DRAFT_250424 [Triangularia verruculosa]
MDAHNSAARNHQRSARDSSAAAGVSSPAAGVSSSRAGPAAAHDVTLPPTAYQNSELFDLSPMTFFDNTEGTTLEKWNRFPPPPLSHYDTPHHTYWNPAKPQPPEKCSPIGPELEQAIDKRVDSTNIFADKQNEIRTEVLAIDEAIRNKQQALEEIRLNKRELNCNKSKDADAFIVEMEQCLFVEQDLIEELEWLREGRQALAKEGKERIEEWLRAERKKYRGY